MKKRKRIYYVPGMISLIILPVLLIGVLKKHDYVERCMPFTMPVPYDPNRPKNALTYDIYTVLLAVKREYVNFELTGNAVNDKKTLDSFQKKLLKIVEDEDTIVGLHIEILENTKYESIIALLDICRQDTFAGAYILEGNEYWYCHARKISDKEKEEKRERYNMYKNDKSIHSDDETDKPEKSFTDKIYAFFHDEGIIKMRYFFILFFLFFIISMLYTRKNFWRK